MSAATTFSSIALLVSIAALTLSYLSYRRTGKSEHHDLRVRLERKRQDLSTQMGRIEIREREILRDLRNVTTPVAVAKIQSIGIVERRSTMITELKATIDEIMKADLIKDPHDVEVALERAIGSAAVLEEQQKNIRESVTTITRFDKANRNAPMPPAS